MIWSTCEESWNTVTLEQFEGVKGIVGSQRTWVATFISEPLHGQHGRPEGLSGRIARFADEE